MELGADDYITKPFTRAELLAAISSRLQKQVTIHQQSEKRLDELRSSITMSLPHEMRTPLNGILGFSELLMQEVNNLSRDEIREMALFIHLSGERLHRLVQNFLLYAELEIIATDSKQINQLRSQKTIFPSIALKKLMIEQAKQAKRDGDLQVNFQSRCCLQICETRLYKILEELIDNALKFSESGTRIELVSTLVSNQLIISLTDHGRGMTAAQIAELGGYRQFERQLYEQQGLGLGLIIAKRMTELHGGELNIQSQLGEKTVVQVMLPCI
jgi:signal transduction histidine kinase